MSEDNEEIKRTILVVEDDEGLNHLIRKNLRREGYQTTFALNGGDALFKISEDENILLLLDYGLPDMTGKQVVEKLITKHRVPFVVMTGQGDERVAVEMMKLGARDYIVKDARFMDLLPIVVRRVLKQLGTESRLDETKAKLYESQRSLSTLMKNLPGMAYRGLNNKERTIVFASEGSTMITGHEPSDLKEIPYIDLIHEDDKKRVLDDIQSALKEKLPFHLVYRIHTANNEEKLVLEKGIGVFSADDKLVAMEGFIMDITEKKQAEVEPEPIIVKDEQFDEKLQSFINILSHDLKGPLRKLLYFGRILQDSLEGNSDSDPNENIGLVIDSAIHMQQVIDDLISYYQITTKAQTLEPVSLKKVVENLKTIGLSARLKETKGEILVLEPLPLVRADQAQIHQLLQNLIVNGLKFNRKGIPPKITVSGKVENGNLVLVEVEDNGMGISETNFDRIFEIFSRLHTEKDYDGTGIGLSVCKNIVKRHGGRIGVKSTPGKGSTFWFTLPAENENSTRKVIEITN